MSNKNDEKGKKFALYAVIVLIVVALVAAVFFATGLMGKWLGWDRNRTLSATEKAVSVDEDGFAMTSVADGLLLRSNCSGLRANRADGETAWDISYKMTSPYMVARGEYACVADLGGTLAVVASSKGELYRLTADKKIQLVSVNAKGEMVLVLQDDDENWVNVYSAEGALLISRHTYQEKDGLVLAAALSDKTERLITSYYKYVGAKCGSVVTVFDLSSQGASLVDRILGSVMVEEEMVVDLSFSDLLCFYASETSFGVINAKDEVKINWSVETGRKLEAVAVGNSSIALVFTDARIGLQISGKAGLSVYNVAGTRVFFEESETIYSLTATNSTYIYGDAYGFTAISEEGVRQWEASLTVTCDEMYAFGDDKTVVAKIKGALQYYEAVNK